MENLNENVIEEQKPGQEAGVNSLVLASGPEAEKITQNLNALHEALIMNRPIKRGDLDDLRRSLGNIKFEYPSGREMTIEGVKEEIAFMRSLVGWEGEGVKFLAEALSPRDKDWIHKVFTLGTSQKDSGQYLVGKERLNLSFEEAPVVVVGSGIMEVSFSDFEYLNRLIEHIANIEKEKYYLPGIEYLQWIMSHKNPESLPTGEGFDSLKAKLSDPGCVFPGLTTCLKGKWYVFCLKYVGDGWSCSKVPLMGEGLDIMGRGVVLLKKEKNGKS